MTEIPVKGQRSYVVGRIEDLSPGSVTIVLHGKFGIGVFNVDGNFYALVNYCPHRGGPTCLGALKEKVETLDEPEGHDVRTRTVLRCPWHGRGFDISTGQHVAVHEQGLRSYPVVVRDGLVILKGL